MPPRLLLSLDPRRLPLPPTTSAVCVCVCDYIRYPGRSMQMGAQDALILRCGGGAVVVAAGAAPAVRRGVNLHAAPQAEGVPSAAAVVVAVNVVVLVMGGGLRVAVPGAPGIAAPRQQLRSLAAAPLHACVGKVEGEVRASASGRAPGAAGARAMRHVR